MSKQQLALAITTLVLLFGLLISNLIVIEEVAECCSIEEEIYTSVEVVNELPTAQWVSLGEFKLTAYCPCSKCCSKWANGITSTGVTAQSRHTIAVDPKVIPYGSEILIGDTVYYAEDCGGAIKGNRIDVYHDTHKEALEFGVQKMEVFIWKEV